MAWCWLPAARLLLGLWLLAQARLQLDQAWTQAKPHLLIQSEVSALLPTPTWTALPAVPQEELAAK